MPKYYCDYCDTYLTHDSPSVRKTHCQGRKHKDNVRFYYQKWMEEQAQHLIDATTAAFKAGKIAAPIRPFGVMPPGVPPIGVQPTITARPPTAPMMVPGMPPPPMVVGPHGPVPQMMGLPPGYSVPVGTIPAVPPPMLSAVPPQAPTAMKQ